MNYSNWFNIFAVSCFLVLFCVLETSAQFSSLGYIDDPDAMDELDPGYHVVFENFGHAIASISDLDGDGIREIAVGTPYNGVYVPTMDEFPDPPPGGGAVIMEHSDRSGRVTIHYMGDDGLAKNVPPLIIDREQNLPGYALENNNRFGSALANIGDLDSNGFEDLAVGVAGRGAILILFMGSSGPISSTEIAGKGFDLSSGDINGDGRPELFDGQAITGGSITVKFLNEDGSLNRDYLINSAATDFIEDDEKFGYSLSFLGDLDGDGRSELASGANLFSGGGSVWILSLESNGLVHNIQEISASSAALSGEISTGDRFGVSLAAMGDQNGDGITDLAVGASHDDDRERDMGAVWMLHLRSDGTVQSHDKINGFSGDFEMLLSERANFGRVVANIGDRHGSSTDDLAVTSTFDDYEFHPNWRGRVWIPISDGSSSSSGSLIDWIRFNWLLLIAIIIPIIFIGPIFRRFGRVDAKVEGIGS